MIRRPPRSTLFPTRRSSDLAYSSLVGPFILSGAGMGLFFAPVANVVLSSVRDRREERSEEHTSELQSPVHLVCRLLLEKKKKQNPDYDSPYDIACTTAD